MRSTNLFKENILSRTIKVRQNSFISLQKTTRKRRYDRLVPKILPSDYDRLDLSSSASNSTIEKKSCYQQSLERSLFGDQQENVRSFAINQNTEKKQSKKKNIVLRKKTTPWKVIGVPGWKDNYYSSLLDWSYNNYICIGCGSNVFLYNMGIIDDDGTCNYRKHHMPVCDQFLTSIKSSPKETKLAIGYSQGHFKVYDYFYEKPIYQYELHDARIATISWEDFLITGSKDQCIKIVDIRCPEKQNCQNIISPPSHTQQICGLKQQGHFLASGGNDNKVYIYDLRKYEIVDQYTHSAAIKALTWLNDGKTLVTGGGTADKKLKFWRDGEGVYKQVDTGSQVCNLLTSRTSNEIVSCQGFSLNQIVIWNYQGIRECTLHGHTSRVIYSALSPHGDCFATGAGDQTLKIWKAFPTREQEGELSLADLR